MLIVGPAILALSDPLNTEVSVFTQTMDALLPAPLAYAGTLAGTAVLLSACATALQGIAHLAHGLSHRHYLSTWLGEANGRGIAQRVVWAAVAACVLCFALFGTSRQRYLIAKRPVHPTGNSFVVPVECGGFFMEAHKDYTNAKRHLAKLVTRVGLTFRDLR